MNYFIETQFPKPKNRQEAFLINDHDFLVRRTTSTTCGPDRIRGLNCRWAVNRLPDYISHLGSPGWPQSVSSLECLQLKYPYVAWQSQELLGHLLYLLSSIKTFIYIFVPRPWGFTLHFLCGVQPVTYLWVLGTVQLSTSHWGRGLWVLGQTQGY